MSSTIKNTNLAFGLVSLDVSLRKATSGAEASFARASKDGNPIKRKEVDGATGEVVLAEDVQRGVMEGEQFKPISAEDIEEIESDAKNALPNIDIEEFCAINRIPTERNTASYYLMPQKGSGSLDGLQLVHDALAKTKTAGLAKMILKNREYLAAVYAKNGSLMVSLLSFADQFQAEPLDGSKPDKAKLDMAVALIRSMEGEGKLLNEARDTLIPERERLIAEALAGKAPKAKPKQPGKIEAKDVTMAALEASLAKVAEGKAKVGA